MEPRVEGVGRRVGGGSPSAAGLLAGSGIAERADHENPASERFQEVATLDGEAVHRTGRELVTLGLDRASVARSLGHVFLAPAGCRGSFDGGDDTLVGATAADVAVHGVYDLTL